MAGPFAGNLGGLAGVPGGIVHPSRCSTGGAGILHNASADGGHELRRAAAGGVRKDRLVGLYRGAANVEKLPGVSGTGSYTFPGSDAGRGEQHANRRRYTVAVAV